MGVPALPRREKMLPGRDSAFHACSVIIWDVYGTAMIGCSRSFPSDLPPPVPILRVASSERFFSFFFCPVLLLFLYGTF